MKVLVTGARGFIGSVLTPMLTERGHDVSGIDIGLFDPCTLGPAPRDEVPSTYCDVRDLGPETVDGFDAVIHLAALSNDPLGDLNENLTYDINHHASVRLAEVAKERGVGRYLFASSCSLYGAGDGFLDETAAFNPLTPYGESKILTEQDVSKLADDNFSPTYLRNATAYGASPRLRADLMVNNLAGHAFTTGKVLIKSDGTPWRPLVHVADICGAFIALLGADRERIHNEAFNVGATAENYQVRDVAELVRDAVPGSEITFAPGASADARDYRVDFSKINDVVPEFTTQWTVSTGIAQLLAAYADAGLTIEDLEGERFMRIKRVQALIDAGTIDTSLRATAAPA